MCILGPRSLCQSMQTVAPQVSVCFDSRHKLNALHSKQPLVLVSTLQQCIRPQNYICTKSKGPQPPSSEDHHQLCRETDSRCKLHCTQFTRAPLIHQTLHTVCLTDVDSWTSLTVQGGAAQNRTKAASHSSAGQRCGRA